MISPFTPDEIDLVSMLLRSRYLSGTAAEARASLRVHRRIRLRLLRPRPPACVEQVANVAGGTTWLANPGTVAGLAAPATWILADRAQLRFDVLTLAGP